MVDQGRSSPMYSTVFLDLPYISCLIGEASIVQYNCDVKRWATSCFRNHGYNNHLPFWTHQQVVTFLRWFLGWPSNSPRSVQIAVDCLMWYLVSCWLGPYNWLLCILLSNAIWSPSSFFLHLPSISGWCLSGNDGCFRALPQWWSECDKSPTLGWDHECQAPKKPDEMEEEIRCSWCSGCSRSKETKRLIHPHRIKGNKELVQDDTGS